MESLVGSTARPHWLSFSHVVMTKCTRDQGGIYNEVWLVGSNANSFIAIFCCLKYKKKYLAIGFLGNES